MRNSSLSYALSAVSVQIARFGENRPADEVGGRLADERVAVEFLAGKMPPR